MCISQYADGKIRNRVASLVGEYSIPSMVWDSLVLVWSRSQYVAGGMISRLLPVRSRDTYNPVLHASHFPILPCPSPFPSVAPNHLYCEISSGRIAVHCLSNGKLNSDLLTTVTIVRFPASSFRPNSSLVMSSSNGLNLRLNGCNGPFRAPACIERQLAPYNVPS